MKIWTLFVKLNPRTSLVLLHRLLQTIQREVKDPHIQGARIWEQAGKRVTSATTIVLWKIHPVSHQRQESIMSGVDCTSAVKGNLQETPLMEQGKENWHCWRDQFWHPWIPPSDLKGCTGTPVSLSSSAASHRLCQGLSLLCYQLKSSSTNKITKPGCIRLFLFCPGPTLNLQIVVIWMGLGGRRGQQSPLPHRRADPQRVSFLHCSWRSSPCQRYFEINGTII